MQLNHALEEQLDSYIDSRKKDQLLRELKVSEPEEQANAFHLYHNDYLQLSKHPKIIQAGQEALAKWGSSSRGSPLVGSYWQIHQDLEDALKQWCGFKHGLVWNSGYAANKALMSFLPQSTDSVLADQYVHNSMLMGTLESKARLVRYCHLDLDHLESLLKEHANLNRTVFVITESIFSMEGEAPDFVQFGRLKETYPFFWIVDEAHSVGWYGNTGNGLVAEFRLQEHVDILITTLGKSLASQGAVMLFHNPKIRTYLINRAPEFVYSTHLPPATAATALMAIEVIQKEIAFKLPQLRTDAANLRTTLRPFFSDLELYDSPIIPLILKDPELTVQTAQLLAQKQIYVGAIRPPSVPKGRSRLRLSLHANLNFEKLAQLLTAFFDTTNIHQ